MSATKAYLYLNTMLLQLRGLTDDRTGTLVTTGAVTADLALTGGSSPIGGSAITLTYDGSDGNWSGLYPSDVPVSVGQLIDARVTIDGGSALARGFLLVSCKVQNRRVPE